MKSIKALALAALAAAALAALPAAASASGGFVADDYPATLHGSQLSDLSISVGGVPVQCKHNEPNPMSFEATLETPSPSVTTSSIDNCGGGLVMNGCQLEFHPGAETFDIGPSECGPVKIYSKYCPGSPFLVPAQDGASATYESFGSGSEAYVRITLGGKGLEYTNPAGICGFQGTRYGLEITGELKVTATDGGENAIGTSVVSELGLFLIGGPPEAETGEPRLAAPSYPVQVTGERLDLGPPYVGEITLFERGSVKASCNVAELDGGELSGPAYNEFMLDAAYSGCKLNSSNATVKMNSCQYTFSELEQVQGPHYEGGAAISCDQAGDAIQVVGPGCTLSIPAQSLVDSAGFSNVGEGHDATVWSNMGSGGVNYTAKGAFCALTFGEELSGENGSLLSHMVLHGEFPG